LCRFLVSPVLQNYARKRCRSCGCAYLYNGKRKDGHSWDGYSGYANPDDVDKADLNKITLGQAWHKYALAGRLPASGIPNGMLVPLRGDLWDLGSNGACIVIKEGRVTSLPIEAGAVLVNLWL